MQLIAPVTDYIPASILTTLGDLPIRGAAIPQRLAGGAEDLHLKGQGLGALPIYEALTLADTGVIMGLFNRNTAGAHAVAGLGFSPSVIIFFACDSIGANLNWSVGFDFATNRSSIASRIGGSTMFRESTRSINIYHDGGNFIQALLASLDADGFTLTWNLTGAREARVIWLALP